MEELVKKISKLNNPSTLKYISSLMPIIVMGIALLILVLTVHILEVKREKEAKEYLDIKVEKNKVSLFNIIRDVLVSIFIGVLLLVVLKYFDIKASILAIAPCFLTIIFYEQRKLRLRFDLRLMIISLTVGLVIRTSLQEVLNLSINIDIQKSIIIMYIAVVIMAYTNIKEIGFLGIGVLLSYLCRSTKEEQFVFFIIGILLGIIYYYSRSAIIVVSLLFGLMLKNIKIEIVIISGVLSLVLLVWYLMTRVTTKKVEKKEGALKTKKDINKKIDLDLCNTSDFVNLEDEIEEPVTSLYREENNNIVYTPFDLEVTNDNYTKFDVNDTGYVNFDVNNNEETPKRKDNGDDIFSTTVELEDDWFKESDDK